MSGHYDLARIQALQGVLGSEADAIIRSLLTTMTAAIDQIEAAMATAQLEQVVQPAHACRNDALMLGARELQAALSELEAAAREGDKSRAHAALERVTALWPATRDGLAGIARSA
jgi:HPt (histidine-containing phosphotransfer) domain-containing protein